MKGRTFLPQDHHDNERRAQLASCVWYLQGDRVENERLSSAQRGDDPTVPGPPGPENWYL